jgi:hypothetical protein
MDEHSQPKTREHKIGFARKGPVVKPISEASLVDRSPNC